ncbi:MAG: site-2 protease family protein [Staphylothermus sp.]|nr:site-2 protease family protein [Staphylothermus sp.]
MFSIIRMNEPLSLLIASLVIAIVFGSSELLYGSYTKFLLVSLIAIIAVIPHELAHRWSARRLGCYSRYVLSPMGLLLTLITAIPFIPVKVIMPGFTLVISHYHDPYVNKRINGVVSLAGPVTNLIFASISLFTLALLLRHGFISFLLVYFLYNNTIINSWVALFNLLPVPPLDGSKIITWKPLLWIISFTLSITMLGASFFLF